MSLDYLMESCSVIGETSNGMIPFFDCEPYIYGVMDSHVAIRASLKVSEQACFPGGLAHWQVYKEIESAIPRSEWGKRPAAPHLIQLLRKKYPCN